MTLHLPQVCGDPGLWRWLPEWFLIRDCDKCQSVHPSLMACGTPPEPRWRRERPFRHRNTHQPCLILPIDSHALRVSRRGIHQPGARILRSRRSRGWRWLSSIFIVLGSGLSEKHRCVGMDLLPAMSGIKSFLWSALDTECENGASFHSLMASGLPWVYGWIGGSVDAWNRKWMESPTIIHLVNMRSADSIIGLMERPFQSDLAFNWNTARCGLSLSGVLQQ